MYSKIVNPATGRKVSITGRLGKTILKKYFNVLNGGARGEGRMATLSPEFLEDLRKITISVMSTDNVVKGKFIIDSTLSLADLVNRVIEILNISGDHWNADNIQLIADGRVIWPTRADGTHADGTHADGTHTIQDIGILTDSNVFFKTKSQSVAELVAVNKRIDAEAAKRVARQRELDAAELDEIAAAWGVSGDSEDSEDSENSFARFFENGSRGDEVVGAAGAVSGDDTSSPRLGELFSRLAAPGGDL